jgi:DNA-nicking Smr family endonuclease
MDRRTLQRLKRGQLEPGARLDLHGMSAERAHPALQRFIGQALDQGLRLVLVITGKGGARTGPGPDAPFMLPPPGLLRRQSPRWLRAGPYGRQIVGMFPAHPRHGGAGAMYVYLKKRR